MNSSDAIWRVVCCFTPMLLYQVNQLCPSFHVLRRSLFLSKAPACFSVSIIIDGYDSWSVGSDMLIILLLADSLVVMNQRNRTTRRDDTGSRERFLECISYIICRSIKCYLYKFIPHLSSLIEEF